MRQTRDRRGFLLPFVLLAVLAITSLALAALALATSEHQGVEWSRGWVGMGAGPGTLPGPEPSRHQVVAHLHGGYRVVRAVEEAPAGPGSGLDPRRVSPLRIHHLAWCLDPAAEAGGAWGPGSGGAVLGPLAGVELVAFVARQGAGEPGAGGAPLVLPGASPGDSLRIHGIPGPDGVVPPLAHVEGVAQGRRVTLVVAAGGVRLEGSGVLDGILLAGGDVTVEAPVLVRGGLRTPGPGGLVDEELTVVDDPLLRRAALDLLPACPVLVHLAGRLGRF